MDTKESGVVPKFNWMRHDDAILEFDQFEMVMKTKMSKGEKPRIYLDDTALVLAAKKMVPAVVPVPSDAQFAAMTPAEISIWQVKYRINQEETKEARKANDLVEAHFAQSLADVEDCFHIKCNARKVIDNAREGTGATFEEKYLAVRAAMKREY